MSHPPARFHSAARGIAPPVAQRLADLLVATLQASGWAPGEATLHEGVDGACRVEVPVVGGTPLEWLARQATDLHVYWGSRDRGLEMAGIGAAETVAGDGNTWDQLIPALRSRLPCQGQRFYGAARFDPRPKIEDHWREFGGYRFVLPRLEVLRRDGQTVVACNVGADGESEAIAAVATADFSITRRAPRSVASFAGPRRDVPDRSGWDTMTATALRQLGADGLQKVVLGRRSDREASQPVDPVTVLRRLDQQAGQAFRFSFQIRNGLAFVGATMERLFSLEGRQVETEAIAGTRRRGASAAEDVQLALALLNSAKDRREHQLVHEGIATTLRALCDDFTQGPLTVLKLGSVQHLATRFHGQLAGDLGPEVLLNALHPTSAVGGTPAEAARRLISELEPFDRGWYAGPLGWVAADSAEFAVGIRSALLDGRTCRIYAANGLITGSDSEAEWQELDHKIRQMETALG